MNDATLVLNVVVRSAHRDKAHRLVLRALKELGMTPDAIAIADYRPLDGHYQAAATIVGWPSEPGDTLVVLLRRFGQLNVWLPPDANRGNTWRLEVSGCAPALEGVVSTGCVVTNADVDAVEFVAGRSRLAWVWVYRGTEPQGRKRWLSES